MIEMIALESIDSDKILPEEILSNFLEKDKEILYIGNLNYFDNCDRIGSDNLNLLDSLDKKYDFCVLTDILEIVDNPQEIIKKVKYNSETTIIYEFKFDDGNYSDKDWKKPWTKIGLEFFLGREFDYMNSVYLGYATIHICKLPYDYETDDYRG